MTQIILNVEDTSILGPLKKIINALDGVSIAKTTRARKSGIEEAYDDIREGRIYKADNVDDMFQQSVISNRIGSYFGNKMTPD